jgi:hypothetical protein
LSGGASGPRPTSRRLRETAAPGRSAEPLAEHFGKATPEIARTGLGQGVGRSQGHRPDRRLRSVLDKGRDDDDAGSISQPQDLGKSFEAARAGHLDVQQNDIHARILKGVERLGSIAGERDDFHVLVV